MKRWNKGWAKLLLVVVLIVGFTYTGVIIGVKYRLNQYLAAKEEQGVPVRYQKLKLKLFEGTATFIAPNLTLRKELKAGYTGTLRFESIKIKDIGYIKLLWTGNLTIDYIELKQLNGLLIKGETKSVTENRSTEKSDELGFAIKLKELILTHANLTVLNQNEKRPLATLSDFNLEIEDILVSSRTLENSFPFTGNSYAITSGPVYLKATAYEDLTLQSISGDSNYTVIKDISYQTVLPPEDFSKGLAVERDHYNITIDSLSFTQLQLTERQKDSLGIAAEHINLHQPYIKIHRNKLVAEDSRYKPMYGELLRKAPIAIQVNHFNFYNTYLAYTEKTKDFNDGGILTFEDMDVEIQNLGNTYSSPLKLHFETQFMGAGKFDADWTFNVKDTTEAFVFKGRLVDFDMRKVNSFTKPVANTELEGNMSELYFTIDGHNYQSTTNLKARYTDLGVYLIQPNSGKRKAIINTILNLFLPSNSQKKEEAFKTSATKLQRDVSRSPFNFVYKSLEKGLQEAML
ncbi:hypothetical protein [Croceivirga sp. JEA036]|uniref:hypothetical protein n=1 Tax=Croceivirga sp. JEA036 TaxID=2721162 RepID=UPI00143C2E6D|nr:hypothetical protein [Croceivirga sp. JEA036]NJB35685.1 hypothetical protein [Croceivirga sp. JEA036]